MTSGQKPVTLPLVITHASERDQIEVEETLTSVVGAILQEPNRVANTIVGVAASKLVAAGVMAGTFSAIGVFGLASTGTAIGTLSGAAALTANLYWIGSTFGLGVAAGGVILAGGAIAVGVPAAIIARRKLFGRPRTEDKLTDRERANLYAALRLATALRVTRFGGRAPTLTEMRIFAKDGLSPLIDDLRKTFIETEPEPDECASPGSSLALWPRQRLRYAVAKLDRLSRKWIAR